MNTCIRLREALVVEAGYRSNNCRLTNLAMAWNDYKNAYDSVPHSWILECLKPYKISNFIKTVNVPLKGNPILKLKKYRRCHHQMRYISRRCSVTLAVLYGAQPVECLAGQEYLWIQVQKWYHYQPPPLHGRHKVICQE